MRTNIVIDENLMSKAKKITGIKTKKDLVEKGLEMLINVYDQSEILKYKGKLKWEGNLNDMREARNDFS